MPDHVVKTLTIMKSAAAIQRIGVVGPSQAE